MKTISQIAITLILTLSLTACDAQIKNAKTETVTIYGNCGMCEKTIEKAGNKKGVATVDWNKDTKVASLTYDEKQTSKDEILKRIALSGYDSDSFLAPDEAYNDLPGCCQYDRKAKTPVKKEAVAETMNHHHEEAATVDVQKAAPLAAVFDKYFAVKDALVKTDGAGASVSATALVQEINKVDMKSLDMNVHTVWMKVLGELKEDAEHISETKDAAHQRDHFDSLSKNIYSLIKVSKVETPVYYQFCPMANDGKGANWLSKENAVKNPYYGSMMMSCGKTVETIK